MPKFLCPWDAPANHRDSEISANFFTAHISARRSSARLQVRPRRLPRPVHHQEQELPARSHNTSPPARSCAARYPISLITIQHGPLHRQRRRRTAHRQPPAQPIAPARVVLLHRKRRGRVHMDRPARPGMVVAHRPLHTTLHLCAHGRGSTLGKYKETLPAHGAARVIGGIG